MNTPKHAHPTEIMIKATHSITKTLNMDATVNKTKKLKQNFFLISADARFLKPTQKQPTAMTNMPAKT
jgi:hypothetical protein